MGKIVAHVTDGFINSDGEYVLPFTATRLDDGELTVAAGRVRITNPTSIAQINQSVANSARLETGDTEEEDEVLVVGGAVELLT